MIESKIVCTIEREDRCKNDNFNFLKGTQLELIKRKNHKVQKSF